MQLLNVWNYSPPLLVINKYMEKETNKEIKRALKKAMGIGGYLPSGGYNRHNFVLDPRFWQSFGKALGWDKIETNPKNVSWLEHWHGFIDHLASGGNPDDFFKELLTLPPLTT